MAPEKQADFFLLLGVRIGSLICINPGDHELAHRASVARLKTEGMEIH
jgi:hypothetical protein